MGPKQGWVLVLLLLGAGGLLAGEGDFDPLQALQQHGGPPTPDGGPRTHVVREGDSLQSIAARILGDADRWNEIYALNRYLIGDPSALLPGMVLALPPKGAVPEGAGPEVAAPEKPPSRAQRPSTYVVRRGDSLSAIAQRLYGSYARWPEIYRLNADLIDDPDLIYPGQVFRLPAPPGGDPDRGPPPSPPSGVTGTPPPTALNPSLSDRARQGAITSQSPQFEAWLREALQIAKGWHFPNIRNKYGEQVTRADFLAAIMYIESRGIHQNASGEVIRSSAGAMGFMQLMPSTAQGLGVDPEDPRQNLLGGTRYLGTTLSGPGTNHPGDNAIDRLIKGAAGYNRGPYAQELRNKSWQEYVRTSRVSENVRYGLYVKMCLGLELSSVERSYLMRTRNLSPDGVERMAAQYYQGAHGLFRA